jgi:hypothetical protein
MKNIQVEFQGQAQSIKYDVEEIEKGKRFVVTDIPAQFKMGNEYIFSVWESNNIYEIPPYEDEDADKCKEQIIVAILKAENIDY